MTPNPDPQPIRAEVSVRIWIDAEDELHISKGSAVGAREEDRQEVGRIAADIVKLAAVVYAEEGTLKSMVLNGEEVL